MAGDDTRTQKGINRAGMGWCQGRVCGFAVSCLSDAGAGDTGAHHGGRSSQAHASLSTSAKRPVAQPVPLGALVDLED